MNGSGSDSPSNKKSAMASENVQEAETKVGPLDGTPLAFSPPRHKTASHREPAAFENEEHESHDDEDHEEHIDERWLVSYSDMMTLLFGLFVMLYSLAMEHKGDINTELQKIQQAESQVNKADQPKLEELVRSLSERENKIAELESKISEMKPLIDEAEGLKQRAQETETKLQELTSENETLKKSSEAASALAQTLSDLQKTKTALEDRTQKLAEANQELDRLRSRAPASENKIETLQNELKKRESEIAKIQEQLRAAQELERENAKVKSELREALSKIAQQGSDKTAGDFLLVVLTWTTEKHDLDMVVKDPQGRSFDFQNRTHAKAPGEFVVDSRTGPGIEVFQAANPEKGEYELAIDFYNAYGNKQDAEVRVSILTPAGEKKLPSFKLNRSNGKTKTFKFRLKDKGSIELSRAG